MALPQSRRLDFSEIPILDVGSLVAGNHDPTLINALHRACADVGFLYVRNHGVSMALVEALKESAAMFFAAPMVEKIKKSRSTREFRATSLWVIAVTTARTEQVPATRKASGSATTVL